MEHFTFIIEDKNAVYHHLRVYDGLICYGRFLHLNVIKLFILD